MKINLRAARTFAAFCVLAGGAAVCLGQPQRIAGGYGDISKKDATVVDAASFAIDRQAEKNASVEMISVERAERQVVAGSNYRLCIAYNAGGKRQEATAVVYHNLRDEFALTSWTPGKCSGAAAGKTPADGDADADETVSFKGALAVGKTDSTILYLGAESGDYAAFCFLNNSEAGRAILAACKNGEQCEFVGKVDFAGPCAVKGLEAGLSASGKITKIESVKSFAVRSGAAAMSSSVSSAAKTALAPDEIVKKLYAAQKSDAGPFFQTASRARVDEYFSKDFADLIWKEALEANGEAGVLEFDPLYNAQDSEITAFKIGKPAYGARGETATVAVGFKNFGKAETIRYLFARDKAEKWKITDVRYQDGETLKKTLVDGLKAI